MKLQGFDMDFPVMLAPMAGITDMPYRRICKMMGCDLTYTEMVSAKGLFYEGRRTKSLLCTAVEERPCAVQIFGSEPGLMAEMARRLTCEHKSELVLIDINMGCPAPKITGNGEGCALMRSPALASRIIEAVSKSSCLPVTVKFRKGWDEGSVNALEFARVAEESGAAAVAVHGRTRSQMYSGKADWDIIGEVKAALSIPVIGNGDVFSGFDAVELRRKTNCDAVMVARGARGNPWIFGEIKAALAGVEFKRPSDAERIDMAILHTCQMEAHIGAHAAAVMRKHIAFYVNGIPGAAKLRREVNACKTVKELVDSLKSYKARSANTP
ncbi:MAG: tRNA-dihydrouridine synthase C [Firmicutes bacterium ADurb.Bin182]|nr:MAG: tRNA-dihydrouridine synthase C [Firmicutes bacterium ADurb.Bin182]